MSIKVKGFLKDVGGASRVTKARREKLERAFHRSPAEGPDPRAV